MKSLSKREKIMILAVIYIGVAYLLFQFAIMPAWNYYQKETERHQTLSEEKLLIDTKIGAMDSYVARYDEHYAKLDWIIKAHPRFLRNERIDDILTGLCVSNGLEPIRLSLSMVETESDDKTSSQSNSSDEEDEEEEEVIRAFTVVEANMTVTGGINQLLGLLKEVEGMEYIRVTRLVFSDRYEDFDYANLDVVLYFEVTMLNVIL